MAHIYTAVGMKKKQEFTRSPSQLQIIDPIPPHPMTVYLPPISCFRWRRRNQVSKYGKVIPSLTAEVEVDVEVDTDRSDGFTELIQDGSESAMLVAECIERVCGYTCMCGVLEEEEEVGLEKPALVQSMAFEVATCGVAAAVGFILGTSLTVRAESEDVRVTAVVGRLV